MQTSETHLTRKTLAGTLTAMFLAALGVDFLVHAGILARYYVHPGPALLTTQQLVRRIPFGYASMLLTLVFELWLLSRMGVRSSKGGAWFGAVFGTVLGVAGAIGLFSLVPLGPNYLAMVAVSQIMEYTIAGALAGSSLASGRALRVVIIGFVTLVIGVAAGLAMQAATPVPALTASM